MKAGKSTIFVLMSIIASLLGCIRSQDAADRHWINTLKTGEGEYYGHFDEIALNAIEVEGWLKTYLSDQASGLTGHVEVAGFPFDTEMWAADKIMDAEIVADWAAYEQTAFYLDGALRVGLLLQDDALLTRVKRQIDYVLKHPDSNGVLGPEHISNRWPHANFFRMMRAYYNATQDKLIIDALVRHYKADTVGHSKAGFGRSSVNIEILCWLYGITGDEELLRRAIEIRQTFDKSEPEMACSTPSLLSNELPHIHGAMFAEMVHLPAVLYMYTGDEIWLRASVNGYEKLQVKEMFINGGFCSQEGTGGKDVRNAHETCALADFIYNTGYLLMATGDVKWADQIERAALNTGTSVVTNNFRAIQYFSASNLLQSTRWGCYIDAPDEKDDTKTHFTRARFMYRPGHAVACCTGSVHRLMPSYVSRMWLSDMKGGLIAALYGPSRIRAKVGCDQVPIKVVQSTDFPFSDKINFQIITPKPVKFSFKLRIPEWTVNPKILVNDNPIEKIPTPGIFLELNQTFNNHDKITLIVPSELKLVEAQGGYAVEKGPIVYTLDIQENRSPVSFTPWGRRNDQRLPNKEYPQWNIVPNNEWRYGFAFDSEEISEVAEFEIKTTVERPWEVGNAPIKLMLPVHLVQNWDYEFKLASEVRIWPAMDESEVRPDIFKFTPALPKNPICKPEVKRVGFVPYGSTCVRMTILPLCISE